MLQNAFISDHYHISKLGKKITMKTKAISLLIVSLLANYVCCKNSESDDFGILNQERFLLSKNRKWNGSENSLFFLILKSLFSRDKFKLKASLFPEDSHPSTGYAIVYVVLSTSR